MIYTTRLFKGLRRYSFGRLTPVDARFFYMLLKERIEYLKNRYNIDKGVLLIKIDNREIFRTKQKLIENGIETIDDFIDYMHLEVKYVLLDNVLIKDRNINIHSSYVLELYTEFIPGEL